MQLAKTQLSSKNIELDFALLSALIMLILIGIITQYSLSSELILSNAENLSYFSIHVIYTVFLITSNILVRRFWNSELIQKLAGKSHYFLMLTLLPSFILRGHYPDTLFPFVLLFIVLFLSFYLSLIKPTEKFFSKEYAFIAVVSLLVCGTFLFHHDLYNVSMLITIVFCITLHAKSYKLSGLVGCFAILVTLPLFSSSYFISRLFSFLTPFDDEFGVGYQLTQSLAAYSGGGIFGVGLNNGIIKGQLPHAHEAFVLSSISEELGILFIAATLITCLFVSYRCFQIASRLRMFNMLFEATLTWSFALIFTFYWVVNSFITVGMFPTKNLLFPLLSFSFTYMWFYITVFSMILFFDSTLRAKSNSEFAGRTNDVNLSRSNIQTNRLSLTVLLLLFVLISVRGTSIALGKGKPAEKYEIYSELATN